ncbi:interleukin-5 receptor subunit alpha isoform X1 [Sciurus carolinensis]|uniref:interleukin-5 receptor subunit alpha isoform X1 n=2 Tax=Sciurus carolinensis TaxID=30640 RepID=UPI001FB35DFC|nr:interleukin-5 receptor subunit alpha isoform X1 [Sciurus carolinensis]
MVPELLILWGATVILQADLLPDPKSSLLPPVNFTIEVMGIAQVLLRWDPNPEQAPGLANLEYHVKINAPWPDDYETGTTQSTFAVPLHQGLSASVQTILQGGPLPLASSWVSAELPAPPGSPGTSVTNLTCITNTVAGHTHRRPYQVSLRCSWRAGAAAPGDTRYSLYYRYGPWTEECREYSTDETRRNTACWFPKTSISSKGHDWLAVRVNGSSRRAAIRPLDRLFAVQAIARANPPANVTAQIQGTHLSIQWDKPFSAFPHHCFDYEVKIYNTKKDYLQMERISSNAFLSVVDAVAEYSVQVRAAVSAACRAAGLWSPWSRPVHVGSEERKPLTEWVLILLTVAVCVALLTCSLLCSTCHLWARLFPPIPAPKSNIKDLLVTAHCEKLGASTTETEVVSFVEEPEFEILENSVF